MAPRRWWSKKRNYLLHAMHFSFSWYFDEYSAGSCLLAKTKGEFAKIKSTLIYMSKDNLYFRLLAEAVEEFAKIKSTSPKTIYTLDF